MSYIPKALILSWCSMYILNMEVGIVVIALRTLKDLVVRKVLIQMDNPDSGVLHKTRRKEENCILYVAESLCVELVSCKAALVGTNLRGKENKSYANQ